MLLQGETNLMDHIMNAMNKTVTFISLNLKEAFEIRWDSSHSLKENQQKR